VNPLSRNPFDGIRQRKLPQAENSRAIAGREDAGERVGGRAAAGGVGGGRGGGGTRVNSPRSGNSPHRRNGGTLEELPVNARTGIRRARIGARAGNLRAGNCRAGNPRAEKSARVDERRRVREGKPEGHGGLVRDGSCSPSA